MTSQPYKVVTTHYHELSVWTIITIILHALEPHLGGTNGDVQSELSTPDFKQG